MRSEKTVRKMVGLIYPQVNKWAWASMAVLMLGAFLMHLKVREPIKKALPSATLLTLFTILSLS